MYEAVQFRNNLEALNDYYERDIQEREEREALIQAYRAWDAEEEGFANPERGSGSGE